MKLSAIMTGAAIVLAVAVAGVTLTRADQERKQQAAARAAAADPKGVSEEKPGQLKRATITPEEARRLALAAVPGGAVVAAELEEEDGVLLYSFDIEVAGQAWITEVHVDAMTGVVGPLEHESADDEDSEDEDGGDDDGGETGAAR
jgi:uncharacterized membrane protein YkoI